MEELMEDYEFIFISDPEFEDRRECPDCGSVLIGRHIEGIYNLICDSCNIVYVI
jgi:ribosomal protein S27AE